MGIFVTENLFRAGFYKKYIKLERSKKNGLKKINIPFDLMQYKGIQRYINTKREKLKKSAVFFNFSIINLTLFRFIFRDQAIADYVQKYATFTITELKTELTSVKDSKKTLQKFLKEFEHDFERKHGNN